MYEPKIMVGCQLCGYSFQFGPHIYNGKHVARYNLTLCSGCYNGSWDGIAPAHEAAFLRHLAAQGLKVPERNVSGWFPRD